MKRKYLLTFALAAMLVFGNAPITANAASPNAGGTIIGEQGQNAGDTLTIGDQELPLAQPGGETTQSDEIGENETPLAVLSADARTGSGFSWWGFAVGVLTTGVVGTGVWAVFKSRGNKSK